MGDNNDKMSPYMVESNSSSSHQMARMAIKSSIHQIIKSSIHQITKSSDRLPSPMDTPHLKDTSIIPVVEMKWIDWPRPSNHRIIKSSNLQIIGPSNHQITKQPDRLPSPMDTPRSMDTSTMAVVVAAAGPTSNKQAMVSI